MRLACLATGAALALGMLVSAGSASLLAESPAAASRTATAVTVVTSPASTMSTLKGVKAVPMASGELDAVKGLHVHFQDAGGGKTHLAGDVKTQNNWQNLGGTDPAPVAPSYHGLCVAAGFSGNGAGAITIVPGGASQCP